MSTMYRRLIEALLTLSETSSCFPRPGTALENGRSHNTSQRKTANKEPCIESQPTTNPTAKQQIAARLSHSNPSSEEDHIPNSQPLTRCTSSSPTNRSTTPASPLRFFPSTHRANLTRRISSWQSNHSNPWPTEDAVGHTKGEAFTSEPTRTSPSESDNEDFIASPDALALSQHEREVLGRTQSVCRSARAARERRLRTRDWKHVDAINGIEPGLYLRGGGPSSSSDNVRPFRSPRRRTTLPVEEPEFPKTDSERPPRGLWWLAGGRKGRVPTLGELRVRKEVERANRRVVGFWGTIWGVRRVGRVGILGKGGEGSGGDVDGEGGEGSGGDVAGDAGGGGGGSLASSHRAREIEMDQVVEEKAESLASATGNAEQSKADTVASTALVEMTSPRRAEA